MSEDKNKTSVLEHLGTHYGGGFAIEEIKPGTKIVLTFGGLEPCDVEVTVNDFECDRPIYLNDMTEMSVVNPTGGAQSITRPILFGDSWKMTNMVSKIRDLISLVFVNKEQKMAFENSLGNILRENL